MAVLVTIAIAVLMAFTGGWSSALRPMLLLVMAAAAASGHRGWWVDASAAAVAAVSPVFYDGADPDVVLSTAIALAVWSVVAIGIARAVAAISQRDGALTQAVAYRDAFLRSVSHELRTPLTIISTGVSTVRGRASEMTTEQISRTLEAVDRNVSRLVRHVEDLTELDRLQRRVVTTAPETTSLSELVLDVAGSIDFNEHRMRLDVERDVWADVDAARLRRAVEEILGNAIRHTGPNTVVTIGLRQEGRRAILTVKDNGVGMPNELSRRAMDPFVQGDASQRAASPGLGVGLALAAEIVHQQGGSLQIASSPEAGTDVTVTLMGTVLNRSSPA